MAQMFISTPIGQEGYSIMRPPFFIGENYSYWRTRMKLCVRANDYQVWKVIVNGPLIPTKKINGVDVSKEEDEWDVNDLKMAQLNAYTLLCIGC